MKRIYILSAFAIMCLPLTVYGETLSIPDGMQRSEPTVTIASVSIENLSYSYDDTSRKMKLDFNLLNEGESINGVNFSVIVRSENGASREYLYSKNLFIGSKQSLAQSVEEVVPPYIFGTSSVMLQAVTSSGMPLVARMRDGVNIKKIIADTTYLDSNSCYLTVSGPTKYNLVQGVDLDVSEQLTLNCNVSSTSKSAFTLTPNLKTYERSTLGKFIEEIKLSPISVKGGTSIVKIPIKIPSTPQAYSSIISINIGTDSIGEVGFHYVVRGESGTVNLVQTDKASYLLGDTAIVKLRWSPRADGFPGSRIGTTTSLGTLNGKVYMTSNGSPCGDPVPFTPSKADEQNYVINLVMKTECNGFNTRVEVRDSVTNAVIVDTSFDTPRDPMADNTNWVQYAVAFGALLISIILIIVLVRLKRNQIQSKTILVIAIAFASFGVVQGVEAYSLPVKICNGGDCVYLTFIGSFETVNSVGTSASIFSLGEMVKVSDSKTKQFFRCGNSGGYDIVQSKISIKSASGALIKSTSYRAFCDSTDSSWCFNNYNWTPTAVGTYTISVTFKVTEGTNQVYSYSYTSPVYSCGWFGCIYIPSVEQLGSNEFTFSKTITVTEPQQNLTVNFSGSGASYGKINLIGATPSPCLGPGPCSYRSGVSSNVTVTNAVSRSSQLNTNAVSCTISRSNPKNNFVLATTGSVSGGTAPYTYRLKNVFSSTNAEVIVPPFNAGNIQYLNWTYNVASSYLEILSSDGQISQKSCGGSSVPALTDGYVSFNGWSGNCTGTASCTVNMSTSKVITADYGITRINNDAPTLIASLVPSSACYDINGSKPVVISITANDKNTDEIKLYADFGEGYVFAGSYRGSSPNNSTISYPYLTVGSKTIALKVIDSYGATSNIVNISANVVADCNPVPTVILKASPMIVAVNKPSTLSWTSIGANSCVTAGDWVIPQTSTSSMGYSTGPLMMAKDYTYSISCLNSFGKSATSTAIVKATSVSPLTIACSANPSFLTTTDIERNVDFTASISESSLPEYTWTVSRSGFADEVSQPTDSSSMLHSVSNYKPGDPAPRFSVTDSSVPPRTGSIQCNALTRSEPMVVSCHLSAQPSHLSAAGNPVLSWTSSNASSCNISYPGSTQYEVLTKDLKVGSVSPGHISTTKTFTLTCSNPAATNQCITTATVTVGDIVTNAILWFDAQFPGLGKPTIDEIMAKPPLTVNQGNDIVINTDFDTDSIGSCKGTKISGPSSGDEINSKWIGSTFDGNTKSVKLSGSGISIGTYKLGLSCSGYDGTSYTSQNEIILKVISSGVREI